MVHWLNAIGIHSRADLERRGVAATYQAMRERGFRATRVALFSLYGALIDKPWRELSDQDKARLTASVGEQSDS